nr:cysteine-rich CWC family protein [Pseudopedobacter sp.]
MSSFSIKTCEQCGCKLVCKPLEINQCQCYQIVLTESQRAYISNNFKDCLCRNCLLQVVQLVN